MISVFFQGKPFNIIVVVVIVVVAAAAAAAVLITQSGSTLCDPMDCSLPGSSVHGILQARILECVTLPFSRGTSLPRDQTLVSHIVGRFFTIWAIGKTNIIVIQVYAPTTNAKEAQVDWFYEDLQHLLELTPKRCPFHHKGLECKSRKSRDNWNNRQIRPWNTKWSKG